MRTKGRHDNEGGVNAGYAVIDSLFIVGKDQYNIEAPLEFI